MIWPPLSRKDRAASIHRITAAAILLCAASDAVAAEALDVVTTPGSGTLTMCRHWLVYKSCSDYHRIAVPERVAVGDTLRLTFGSNPKDYNFRVVRLRRTGDTCTIFSDSSNSGETGERLEIVPCQVATKPGAR